MVGLVLGEFADRIGRGFAGNDVVSRVGFGNEEPAGVAALPPVGRGCLEPSLVTSTGGRSCLGDSEAEIGPLMIRDIARASAMSPKEGTQKALKNSHISSSEFVGQLTVGSRSTSTYERGNLSPRIVVLIDTQGVQARIRGD